jgi:hypothetical protein
LSAVAVAAGVSLAGASAALGLASAVVEDDELLRLSVMYQPEPLKTMPVG